MDELKDFSEPDEQVEGVVTNYLVVYEVVDPETFERHLRVRASRGMTPWLADGMVKLGIEIMESEGILFEYYE